MLTYLQLEQLLLNFKAHSDFDASTYWALRDEKARYLAASPDYLDLLTTNMNNAPLTIASLALDEHSKASLLYQDSLAFKAQDKLTTLQAVILKERLELLEVTRYPVHGSAPSIPLAIGIVIRRITEPAQLKPSAHESEHQPDKIYNNLKERDLLIGLLLLDNWTLDAIAKCLQVSYSRLCHILFRICRRNFGVKGGGAKFRELFIQHTLYKQIPLNILKQYLVLNKNSHTLM